MVHFCTYLFMYSTSVVLDPLYYPSRDLCIGVRRGLDGRIPHKSRDFLPSPPTLSLPGKLHGALS